LRRVAPGVLVAVASIAIARVETRLFGSPVIEALVVALLVGMIVRLVWRPNARLEPGIRFAGKQVLELSVAILGISVESVRRARGVECVGGAAGLGGGVSGEMLSGQVATLVTLVRVLMLGPVVLFFSVRERDRFAHAPSLTTLVPWFIVGFLALATLRATGAVPASWISPTRLASTNLTIVAMAALGLRADVRTVARAGSRVVAAVSLSLLLLVVLGIAFIHLLNIR